MAMYATERRRPLTVDEVLRMVEVGILTEDDRVELLNGELVEMTPQGPLHGNASTRLRVRLGDIYGHARVREEKPLQLGRHNLPEPDVMVLRGTDYPDAHPSGADTILVVEVSVTSQTRDQDKSHLYARGGVPEYWIVDATTREVTVHRGPRDDGTWNRITRQPIATPLPLPETTETLVLADTL